MPIKIPDGLPAKEILLGENIFVMDENRAVHQDIRPLRIAILNLMPTKIATETQLLRLLGNTSLQVEITLVRVITHQSKNTPEEHLITFYQTFDQLRSQKFDGFIITGAPVEQMPFEEVDYWPELTEIIEWSRSNVIRRSLFVGARRPLCTTSTASQNTRLPQKMFGAFEHHINRQNVPLLRGFDDVFLRPPFAPHRDPA